MLILFSTGVPAFVPFRVHFQYSLSCTEDLVRMYRSAVTFYLNFKISQRIFRKLLSVGVSCAQKTMLNANISVFQNFLQKSFVGKFWILAPLKFWSHDAPGHNKSHGAAAFTAFANNGGLKIPSESI